MCAKYATGSGPLSCCVHCAVCAVPRLEDRMGALRNELHERERQVAELNISHQVSRGQLHAQLSCTLCLKPLFNASTLNVYSCSSWHLLTSTADNGQ